MIKENLTILSRSIENFKATGCLWESSRWVAKALNEPIRKKKLKTDEPRRILEVGAGTGAITRPLIKELGPQDELVVCELSGKLLHALRNSLEGTHSYLKNEERIAFFEGAIQDLPESGEKFDYIVCSLPFLNFDEQLVDEIFRKLLRLSHQDTLMTYFEYMAFRHLSLVVSPPERKSRMQKISEYIGREYKPRTVKKEKVWLNLSPANIYTLKMAA